METLLDALILIFWIVYPVFAIGASGFVTMRFGLKKKYNVKPVDIALPLLLIGLNALSRIAFGTSILLYFLLSVFLLGLSVAWFQSYFYEEIAYPRFMKMFWRLTFLITLITHVVLVVLNIILLF